MNGDMHATSHLNKVQSDVKSIRMYSSQLENQLHFQVASAGD